MKRELRFGEVGCLIHRSNITESVYFDKTLFKEMIRFRLLSTKVRFMVPRCTVDPLGINETTASSSVAVYCSQEIDRSRLGDP